VGSAVVGIRATLTALGYANLANLASGRLLLGALTLVVLARRIGVTAQLARSFPCLPRSARPASA
jgi:hypothetical protein